MCRDLGTQENGGSGEGQDPPSAGPFPGLPAAALQVQCACALVSQGAGGEVGLREKDPRWPVRSARAPIRPATVGSSSWRNLTRRLAKAGRLAQVREDQAGGWSPNSGCFYYMLKCAPLTKTTSCSLHILPVASSNLAVTPLQPKLQLVLTSTLNPSFFLTHCTQALPATTPLKWRFVTATSGR